INGDNLVAHKNDGVHDGAVSKGVLHLITPHGEHILKQGLQIIFSQYPPLFWVLEDVLQTLELVSKRDDLLVGLVQAREFLGNVADDVRRALELGVHVLGEVPLTLGKAFGNLLGELLISACETKQSKNDGYTEPDEGNRKEANILHAL